MSHCFSLWCHQWGQWCSGWQSTEDSDLVCRSSIISRTMIGKKLESQGNRKGIYRKWSLNVGGLMTHTSKTTWHPFTVVKLKHTIANILQKTSIISQLFGLDLYSLIRVFHKYCLNVFVKNPDFLWFWPGPWKSILATLPHPPPPTLTRP